MVFLGDRRQLLESVLFYKYLDRDFLIPMAEKRMKKPIEI